MAPAAIRTRLFPMPSIILLTCTGPMTLLTVVVRLEPDCFGLISHPITNGVSCQNSGCHPEKTGFAVDGFRQVSRLAAILNVYGVFLPDWLLITAIVLYPLVRSEGVLCRSFDGNRNFERGWAIHLRLNSSFRVLV